MSFYTKTITRYVRARRGFSRVVTSFSISGIILGVAALIVVMSVMNGFRAELLSRILGMTGHAIVSENGLSLQQAQEYQHALIKNPEILKVQPFVLGQAMVISKSNAGGALVRGTIIAEDENIIKSNIKSGNFNRLVNKNAVAIGSGMASDLGLGVGSKLTLLSPQGTRTVMGFIPRMVPMEVVAIFDIGMNQYDDGLVYMSVDNAQKFFKLKDGVTALDIHVKNPDKIDAVVPFIKKETRPYTSIVTWQKSNRQFFSALQVERVSMFIILSLIVVVAAFNIITGQMMLVNDKRGDIAIMRTMGAKRGQILNVFFFNGMLIGGVGTLLGTVAGLLVVRYLEPIVTFIEGLTGAAIFSGEGYFLDELPSKVIMSDILIIVGVSLILTLLASLYPAWRACRMDPVEVLRS
jgi:lipoprotein-releasing system permease protein